MLIYKFLLILFLLPATLLFAIGGKGPLEMSKEGVKNEKPYYINKIGVDEKLGEILNLDFPVKLDSGQEVQFGPWMKSLKGPIFLFPVYFNCPTLCSTHMSSFMRDLRGLEDMVAGLDFQVIFFSIDPKENENDAKLSREKYLSMYEKNPKGKGWYFITAKKDALKQITQELGFQYFWDESMQQWAHISLSYVLDAQLKITHYHYGLTTDANKMRLSVVEASGGRVGKVIDKILLYCLQYDSEKKTYSLYAYNIMKLASILMAIILITFLSIFWYKYSKESK